MSLSPISNSEVARTEGRRPASEALRTAILDAALTCFSQYGQDGTTIERLCERAGCSIGSIYHHFGNKEGVASGLFIHAIMLLNDDLLRQLSRCRTAEQGVRTVVMQYCDWVTANPELARYLVSSRDIMFSDAAKRRLRQLHQDNIKKVFAWFMPDVMARQMKALPVETYVPIISGPIQDYCRHWLMGRHQMSPTAVKDLFADAAWNAVRGSATLNQKREPISGRDE